MTTTLPPAARSHALEPRYYIDKRTARAAQKQRGPSAGDRADLTQEPMLECSAEKWTIAERGGKVVVKVLKSTTAHPARSLLLIFAD